VSGGRQQLFQRPHQVFLANVCPACLEAQVAKVHQLAAGPVRFAS
jgi:hypothetical protein